MTDAAFEAAAGKIRAGDRDGLREIYDAYGDTIYRLFLSKTHHREDAEDLTSDYFLRLWECAGEYRPGQGHRGWMMTIARNMATDHFRKHSRMTPVEDAGAAAPGAFTEHTSAEDTVIGEMTVTALLDRLNEDEQEIVRMHIAAELTFREIASILKRPLGTVAWKYRTAMEKLRRLAKEGEIV